MFPGVGPYKYQRQCYMNAIICYGNRNWNLHRAEYKGLGAVGYLPGSVCGNRGKEAKGLITAAVSQRPAQDHDECTYMTAVT